MVLLLKIVALFKTLSFLFAKFVLYFSRTFKHKRTHFIAWVRYTLGLLCVSSRCALVLSDMQEKLGVLHKYEVFKINTKCKKLQGRFFLINISALVQGSGKAVVLFKFPALVLWLKTITYVLLEAIKN